MPLRTVGTSVAERLAQTPQKLVMAPLNAGTIMDRSALNYSGDLNSLKRGIQLAKSSQPGVEISRRRACQCCSLPETPSRSPMLRYPPYTTTVIGAHSVPRWYETFDRLIAMGQLAEGDFADAQLRLTQAAILEQEVAGIDVITGGEMHRRRHNRHSPPNAMLNHFWHKIPAFQGETRPKAITPYDPNVFHPAAVCRGPIPESVDLGLADEFRIVSSFASKPVKITMTGPHLLAAVAYDEYYNDTKRMIGDFGKLIRQNFRRLVEAGCKHIQIDEPYFTVASDDEVQSAVDAINSSIDGLPDDVHVMVHICQGNYAVGPDYDGQIGHRYFDQGRYKADLVCKIECDGYLIEHDMTPHYESYLGEKQLGIGAVDVQAPNVESGEQVADRIRTHRWLAAEQTVITSSCGFNHLPRHIALGKLRAMAEAKAILAGSGRPGRA
jgi:5-methyltetrahydropteroyltriglutamate--homocysteine methyltransferase